MGPAGNPQTRQWDCLRQEPGVWERKRSLPGRAQQVRGTVAPGALAGRVGGFPVSRSQWALPKWTGSQPSPGRRGQEGQKRKTGPPRPPCSAPNAARLPPNTPSTRGTRVAPIRAPGRARGEGSGPDSATSAALPGVPAQPQERPQPPELTPPGPPQGDPRPPRKGRGAPRHTCTAPASGSPGL